MGNHLHQSMQSSELKLQSDWPTTLPDEENRIRAFNGTSIVAPAGWLAKIAENSVEVIAPGHDERTSRFVVKVVSDRHRHQQPLPRTHLFQNGHACVKILHVKTTPFEPARHEAQVIVDCDGTLYEISFVTYKHFTKQVPDRIWNYLETFELSDKKMTVMLD
ncbi:MAG: hypothetical protein P8M30_02050 [Planctomycetaceae bacterium]|nr:hypothetical protein [Planctomycetaceae bacterium]